jgi:hypothetical protein
MRAVVMITMLFVVRRDSHKYLKQVFVLGFVPHPSPDVVSPALELIGTAFAITKRHVVTAGHNLLDPDTNEKLLGNWSIARKATKKNGRYVFPAPIAVTIKLLGQDEDGADWAILEVDDSNHYFESYLPICKEPFLPKTEAENEKLKAFYAPIGTFKTNGFVDLHIWPDDYQQVLQYDKEGTVILVTTGLYKGSCGGPYVSKAGLAVALHLSSMHEGKNISIVKKRKRNVAELNEAVIQLVEASTDMADVHESIREGLVLARVPQIVALVERENEASLV